MPAVDPALDPRENPYAPPAAPLLDESEDGDEWVQSRSDYEGERRSVVLMVVLWVVTAGIYPFIWFVRRTRFLDSLDADKKSACCRGCPLGVSS
jgi:hypothetical protein